MAARVVFIKWLVTFFLEKKYVASTQSTKNGGEVLPKLIQVCEVVPGPMYCIRTYAIKCSCA